MLKTLYDCSKSFLSEEQIGYGFAIVHYRVNFEEWSEQPIITLLSENKGKKTDLGQKLLVPELLRNSDQPLLIDDTGEYVFGVGERGNKRHELYLNLLTECYQETQDIAVKRILDYLTHCEVNALDDYIRNNLLPPKKTPYDSFCWQRERFIFTENEEIITYRPQVREFWQNYFIRQQDTIEATCLLTGSQTLTLNRKMPQKIKGVPNTQSSGAALTSFDKDAYTSYGWDGNHNAPIGFEEAIAVHSFLNFLLRDPRFHYKQGNQVFVYWSEGFCLNANFWDDPEEFWQDAADKDAKIAETLFQSIESGKLPRKDKPFYLAILKGNKGRIALSAWHETNNAQLTANIRNFIASQKEIQFSDQDKAKPLWVLKNCAFRDPRKEYTDQVELALIKAILLGESLPDTYALRIIDRLCLDSLSELGFREHQRCAFSERIKALLFYRSLLPKMTETDTLSPEKLAYILGRIAFLMHWAQKTAQNLSREETNVSRSLKALSTTPATVFPRLYYGCIAHHLEDRDGQKNTGGILHNLKVRLDEEFLKLGNYNPDADLPKTFTVRQQAQFFIGFAQARAEYFTKSTQKEDN